ncbi:hypothetical protein ATL17_1211 [Maritalea mobilis]|uniref:Uncharacterized protein n=1 Tax=Maritalea mobilis TaxID=483324 RepID=A0A4R6VWR8_9HYPH|nr:DUF6498-containing protein [Maritalea mobilis]TDQ67204.1 hypothetical protein ATL17_1211 [Maritalea mobilis]
MSTRSTLLLLANNILPLLGVLLLGWSVFELLLAFLLESVAIAFWTLLILLFSKKRRQHELEYSPRHFWPKRIFDLFTVLGVCAIFFPSTFYLYGRVYGGIPLARFGNPADLFQEIIIAKQLYWPPLTTFVMGAYAFLFERNWLDLDQLYANLFIRIAMLQIVLVIGAMLSVKFGAMAGYIIFWTMQILLDFIYLQNPKAVETE